MPVFVEVLAKFPLTNTMKLDRRALERLAAARITEEKAA